MLDFVAIVFLFTLDYFVRFRSGVLRVQPISGDCKERVTLCSGFSGVNALSGLLGQSPNPLGRAHNYESGACSYSGL